MTSSSPKIGVILAQVGTPEAPTKRHLKKYLKHFLSDERVMDLPRWYWLPILHTMVLTRRPAVMAKNYQAIWTKKGSPLLVNSLKVVRIVQQNLGRNFQVELGFAYAEPSMKTAVAKLEAAGITKIIILPLFPQFSTTTTASIYDEIMFQSLGRGQRKGKPTKKYIPTLRFIPPFYDDPDYITVLANDIDRQLKALPHKPDQLIISFHGIPQRYVDEGDPYPQHCQTTLALLVDKLNLDPAFYQQTFQSRFGREVWLQPYTQEILPQLAKQGHQSVAIMAPGFTTDCLETVDELGNEGAELFTHGGGNPDHFYRLNCLNDTPAWTTYLSQLILKNAQGWT